MKTTDCITHADILDLETLRERMESLEASLAEILNTGNLEALQEFTGGMDLTAEDLADFTLADYVSPDFEESEAEELLALRGAFDDIGTCAGNALIAEDHFEEYTQRTTEDVGDLPGGKDNWLFQFIDWKAAADYMQLDYSKIVVGSVDYWVQS